MVFTVLHILIIDSDQCFVKNDTKRRRLIDEEASSEGTSISIERTPINTTEYRSFIKFTQTPIAPAFSINLIIVPKRASNLILITPNLNLPAISLRPASRLSHRWLLRPRSLLVQVRRAVKYQLKSQRSHRSG